MVTLYVPIKFGSKLVLTKDDPCNSTHATLPYKKFSSAQTCLGSNSASYLVRQKTKNYS